MSSPEPARFPYRRILVATGGAPHSHKAVGRALTLARSAGAVLEVVFVVPVVTGALVNLAASFPGGGGLETQAVQDAAAAGQAHLQQVVQLAREVGVETRVHLVQAAKPADAILSVAQETGADLIVLGRRHVSALSAAVAGSTGDAVSHASPVDVLIAR